MMGERKLKIADVSRACDLHRNTVTALYFERASRVDLDVIDKLCGFFDCQVSDLLERLPETAGK